MQSAVQAQGDGTHIDDGCRAETVAFVQGERLTGLDALDEETLKMILTEPKNAVLKQYKCLLAMDGVDLEFEPEAIDLIAQKAIKRKTGARALRSIVEELMLDVMYDIPTKHDIDKFVVTKEMVEKQDEIDNQAELIHLPNTKKSDISQKTRAEIA